MNRVYNVEVNFPNGAWRTIQKTAETSQDAAQLAMDEYPAAGYVTAWAPGGAQGLDRTDVSTITGYAKATEPEPPKRTDSVIPWGELRSLWL